MLRGVWRPILARNLRSRSLILGHKYSIIRHYSEKSSNNENDPLNLDALFGSLKEENDPKIVHHAENNQEFHHELENAINENENTENFDKAAPEELSEDKLKGFINTELGGAEMGKGFDNSATENEDLLDNGPEEDDFDVEDPFLSSVFEENSGDSSPHEFLETPASHNIFEGEITKEDFEDFTAEELLEDFPGEQQSFPGDLLEGFSSEELLEEHSTDTSPIGTKTDTLYDDIIKDIESYIDDKGVAGIDLDHNDEVSYRLDVPVDQQPSAEVVQEEKNLFKNIFSTFLQPTEDESIKLRAEDNILWNLKDSLKKSQDKFNSLEIKQKLAEFNKISDLLKGLVFQRTEVALSDTVNYIDTELVTLEQQLAFLKDTYGRWCESLEAAKSDTYVHEQTYLGHVLRLTGPRFMRELSDLVRTIRERSEESPKKPQLNVFTMPVIFNHVLRNLGYRLYAGQVALSVFNLLKKDLNVYSTIINQQTYNEVLKMYWLYQGKANLYGIEMIYIEMLNNGFTGDVVTFNVLKQIIVDYHTLKLGKGESGLPLWTREDDKRVHSLELKLSRLATQLKRSQ